MRLINSSSTERLHFIVLLGYSVALLCLLNFQSLWVDEIMQVLGTRSGNWDQVEQLTRSGVGGVPLGWLPQLAAIKLLGFSVFASRLPSALASIAACIAVYFTARDFSLRYPIMVALLFGVLPLQFRYALEARPYAQGLFFSALATLLFARLINRPQSKRLLIAYALTVIAGMYSQPFACFTGAAHFVWAAATRERRLALYSALALLMTAISFVPWYFYAAPLWRQTIHSGGLQFQLSLKTPLMLVREISGAGYFGGIFLLAFAIIGFSKGALDKPLKWLLLACTIVPLCLALTVDSLFSYFLAIRQMIFILPPLAILAACGLASLRPKAMLTVALLAVFGYLTADAHWLLKPRENWAEAAQTIRDASREYSACVVYAAPECAPYYALFDQSLEGNRCTPNAATSGTIVLAIPPYTTEVERHDTQALIAGKQILFDRVSGMSVIKVVR